MANQTSFWKHSNIFPTEANNLLVSGNLDSDLNLNIDHTLYFCRAWHSDDGHTFRVDLYNFHGLGNCDSALIQVEEHSISAINSPLYQYESGARVDSE